MTWFIRRLICRVIGHNWHEHGTYGTGTTPFCLCSRCGKTGWLL